MSAVTQTNGKKSSNSSAVNTPASTPVTNGNGPQITPPLPNNNAPKFGTLVPNRIFVGGISANTTEGELLQLFSNYGTVKAAKIIQDRAGVSRGYGFITFESEDDAKRPLKDADNIVLRERKLNIAPAIKKQPFSRTFDTSTPPNVAAGNPAQYFFPPTAGVPYFQTAGVTYYPQPTPSAAAVAAAATTPGDPNSQPTTVYQAAPPVYPAQSGPPQAPGYPSMMFPQTIYMPQQYPMPLPYEFNYYANNGGSQYMIGGQNGPSSTTTSQSSSSSSTMSSNGSIPPPPPPSHTPQQHQQQTMSNTTTTMQQPPPPPPTTNSPPRLPPCYNQQLHYNPDTTTVFYNMPMYGNPLDGTPIIYSDGSIDLMNGGGTTTPINSVCNGGSSSGGGGNGNGSGNGLNGNCNGLFTNYNEVRSMNVQNNTNNGSNNNNNNNGFNRRNKRTTRRSSQTTIVAIATSTNTTTTTTLTKNENGTLNDIGAGDGPQTTTTTTGSSSNNNNNNNTSEIDEAAKQVEVLKI